MGSLSNLYISQSYTSLIHLGNDTTIGTASVELQDGLGNGIGVSVNSSGDVSLSGSLSASLTQGYTWVGDSNNRTKLVSTSSFGGTTDLTSLNAFTASQETKNTTLASVTASLNANTASQQSQINSLIAATGSYASTSSIIPLTSLNAYTASNDTKWSNLGSQSGSWITESETGSFAKTDVNNIFSGVQTFNSISASGDIKGLYFQGPSVYTNVIQDGLGTISGVIGVSGSLSITNALSASLPQGYVWVGDSNNRTALVATSSFGGGTSDLTSLNAFTASQETKNSTLASYTSSVDTQLTNLSTSQSIDVQKWINISSQSGSWGASSGSIPTGTVSSSAQILNYGIFATTGSNTFVGTQTISGSIDVTGNITLINGNAVSASDFHALGANGILFKANTGTDVALFGAGGGNGATFYGQVNANAISASSITGIGNVTDYSTSVDSRLDGLEALTSSIVPLTSLNAYTASNDTKWSNLGSQSGSWITESETGSFATLGANVFNGNQTISGSLLNQGNVQILGGGSLSIQANTAGSGSLYSNVQIVVDTATDPTNVYSSYQAVDSFNSGLFGIGISSYSSQEGAVPAFYFYGGGQSVSNTPIMTASPTDNNINFWKDNNIFKGNLTVTGSTNITTLTASLQQGYVWVGDANNKTTLVATASFAGGVPVGVATTGSNVFNGNQTITGSLLVSGAFSSIVSAPGTDSQNNWFSYGGFTGNNSVVYPNATVGLQNYAGSDLDHAFTVTYANTDYNYFSSLKVGESDFAYFLGDGNYDYDYSKISLVDNGDQTATATVKADNVVIQGTTQLTGSLSVSSTLTASLQQGYVWVGDSNGKTTTVATSSFGGGGAAFPYTGDAQISGSLGVTGSVSGKVNALVVTGTTASLDFSLGNMFTLTLPSASTTYFNPSNIKAGQTINVQLTQQTPGTGSVSFAPSIKFAGGNDYQATATGSAIDLITFISLDGTNVLATSIKNFL